MILPGLSSIASRYRASDAVDRARTRTRNPLAETLPVRHPGPRCALIFLRALGDTAWLGPPCHIVIGRPRTIRAGVPLAVEDELPAIGLQVGARSSPSLMVRRHHGAVCIHQAELVIVAAVMLADVGNRSLEPAHLGQLGVIAAVGTPGHPTSDEQRSSFAACARAPGRIRTPGTWPQSIRCVVRRK